ncbi:MAG: sulfurtransferase TusA family protein [Candidatus Heimdallarchaeota archaeon]|nr:sulfurtransferase TusA family protein [Candidatus Heimdallarchaeota archaeon]MCK4770980.1 sulfurtransferase TusA family protein [Candidatus Heimdallarchaeota archaeon]
MNDAIVPDQTLDVKGLSCPMPIVKLASAIKKIEIGQIIEVLATDPGSVPDIAAWSKTSGNEVLKHKKDGKVLKFYVARRK